MLRSYPESIGPRLEKTAKPNWIGPIHDGRDLRRIVTHHMPHVIVCPQGWDADRKIETCGWLAERYGPHALVRVGSNHYEGIIYVDPEARWSFSGALNTFYFREVSAAVEWKVRWY